MASKKKVPATQAIDTPAIPAIPAPAAVEVVAAPAAPVPAPKPKAIRIAPYTGKPVELHRLEGADVFLRTLGARVAAFERRLPDPADALSANEMERRSNIKARTVRISRTLSNAAGLVMVKVKHLAKGVAWVDTLEEVSVELQAKLTELYQVIPEARYSPAMIDGGGPGSGNTITARKIYETRARSLAAWIDYIECPSCYAMLDESQPVKVEAVRAPISRAAFTGLTGGATSEEAYALLEAPIPDAAGHSTYIVEAEHITCPHCAATLRKAEITNSSNLRALYEARPGVDWLGSQSLYTSLAWLDQTGKEVDTIIAEVQSSIAFAEGLESAKPEDDIAVPHVTDPTPKLEELKAAAYAAIA